MNFLPASSLALMGLGPTELIVILVILLLLFGGSKLPALAKGLGQSVKEFKNAAKEDSESDKKTEQPKSDTAGNDASKLRNN